MNLKGKFLIGLSVIAVAILSGVIIAKLGALSLLAIPVIILAIFLVYLVLKNPSLGFFMIVFFLPFERIPTYDIGGINLKINTLLGFLTLVAWILALLFNGKKWRIQPNALSIPLAVFVMALILSLPNALNFERALQVFIFSIFTIALSILTVSMIKDRESLEKTLRVLFWSSAVVGFFGLFQFAGDVVGLPPSITLLKAGYDSVTFGFPRIQSFSMEPLYFANYLLIPLSLALAYLWEKAKNKEGVTSGLGFFKQSWVVLLLIILLLLNFVLTVSRGGYLAFIGVMIVMGFFYARRIFTWKNVLIGAIVGILVGYGVAFALSKGDYRATNEFIGHVMLKDYNAGESVQGRFQTFRVALQAYSWSPVTGIGLGNYGPYERNYPLEAPKSGWPIVNNEYFELLAETGLVGVISFVIILLVLFIRHFIALKYVKDPLYRATLIGLLAAFIGVLIQYNSFSTLYIIHIWVLIGLIIVVQNLVLVGKKDKSKDKSTV